MSLPSLKLLILFLLLAATPLEASSCTLNVFFLQISNLRKNCLSCVMKSENIFCDFSWEGGGTLPQNSQKNFPGPMRSYSVKENPIGSAVSEILWQRQTDILLLYYKDQRLRPQPLGVKQTKTGDTTANFKHIFKKLRFFFGGWGIQTPKKIA